MKFARGLAVVSWLSVSLPLAIACGGAGSSNLFSASGGETSVDRAGAEGIAAGSSSAGADTAGTSAGGASEGGARGGEPGAAGKGSAGAAEPGGGSPGAGAGGKGHGGGSAGAASGGGASGGASTGAGGAAAGAAGGTAGAETGGSGGLVGSNGGASGSGNGEGCPINGAPTPGDACQVTTPDSCFYSGIACSCEQLGASSFARKWACYGTPDKCPDKAPAPDSGPCKSGAECPYPGGDFCACAGGGGEPKYSCRPETSACPEMKPFKGMACQLPVKSCAYADDQCFCNGDNWTCESNGN
jgi:hypothetical protein